MLGLVTHIMSVTNIAFFGLAGASLKLVRVPDFLRVAAASPPVCNTSTRLV
jgi:hypothetical protein